MVFQQSVFKMVAKSPFRKLQKHMAAVYEAAELLPNLIQLVFTKDTMLTISDNFKDWENIKRVKVAGHDPRAILYSLTKSLGSQAVQGRKRGKDALPTAKGAKYVEAEARLKRLYSAIEIDYDLFEGAKVTPQKYADPLAQEIKLKSIAQNRYLSGVVNRDGSSILATVSADGEGTDEIGDVIINFESSPAVGGYGDDGDSCGRPFKNHHRFACGVEGGSAGLHLRAL